MRKLVIILILVTSLQAQRIADDKFKHAFVGLTIYTGCIMGGAIIGKENLFNAETCLAPVILAGIGKEVYDSRHTGHTSEFMDVVATTAIPLMVFTVYKW